MKKLKNVINEKKIEGVKNIFHSTGTRHGAYSLGLTTLVIAVVIVFNIVIGQVSESYSNLDECSNKNDNY